MVTRPTKEGGKDSSAELCVQSAKVGVRGVLMKKCSKDQNVILYSFNSTPNHWAEWVGLESSLRLAVDRGCGILIELCRAVGIS